MDGILKWLTELAKQVKLWAVIAPWERGIRVRLGKNAALLEPGVHLRIPLVDEIILFNNRLRIATFPGQTIRTADGHTVTVAGNVGFRIDDPLRAMLSLQQPEYSCAAVVQTSVSSYVTTRGYEEIDVAEMESQACEELARIADGLAIEFVRLTDFAPVSRTFRLLGDEWRPSTKPDQHDAYSG